MGATRLQMLRVFLLQGALFGLAGSVVGGTAGYGLVWLFNAYGPRLFHIPVSPLLLFAATILATVTGVISAAIPARRAARLDPVVAIRHV
jgi:lipoprotein-releasing system permease protein